MADDKLALEQTWQEVVAELVGASERPESTIPTLTHKQRAFLTLAKPIVLVDGYVLLATPHQMAKKVVEVELGEHITRVLSERMHRPCSLAVSVDPEAAHREAREAQAVADAASTPAEPVAAPGHPAAGQSDAAVPAADRPMPGQYVAEQAVPGQSVAGQSAPGQFGGVQPGSGQSDPGQSSPGRPDPTTLTADQSVAGRFPAHDTFHRQLTDLQEPPSTTAAPASAAPDTTVPDTAAPATAAPGGTLAGNAAPGDGAGTAPGGADAASASGAPTPVNGEAAQWRNTYSQPAARIPREAPAHDPNRETSLNPRYTFDSFVIGSSNRFANGAAVAVAENPARAYNPLFISGGSGLGKTHLLHAAGNYAKLLQPSLRIKYVSSEEFTNDYINSVRDDRQESFKRRYRNLDILMVDDIQFLQGKEGTQEEFFHTFNALHQANKQIILSSDRPPKELTTLEDRLRTRFQAGLIADIQPPDLETRIAILMKKAEADGTRVDRDVLELIASRFESSIRELEGALVRVSAYSSLIKEPIDRANAEVALRDILPDPQDVVITASAIIDTTAEHFGISTETLCGTGKTRAVTHARQLGMYLCRELTDLSLPKIGDHFGGKDHTTVMYADRKIRKEMTEKRDTYDEIQLLTQKIKNAGRAGV